MYKVLIPLVLLFTLLFSFTVIQAQDQPQPGSPEENACNPGGVLYREGNQDGCPTEWYWKAGWFLSRFLSGKISRDQFPDEFASALPPEPAAPLVPIITICHSDNVSFIICANSDRTGIIEYLDGRKAGDVLFVDSLPCPQELNGVPFLLIIMWNPVDVVLVNRYGFNLDDVASLNLTPSTMVCSYQH